MGYNSTIKQHYGVCGLCSDGKEKPLIKGVCSSHYWLNVRMKSFAKQQEKEATKSESLQTLIDDLDIIFSKYIRLKSADQFGYTTCITCGDKQKWQHHQCGHFVPRGNMYTRFMEENCGVQCSWCNENLRGNLIAFAKYLNSIRPGLAEQLQQQSHIVYHYSKDELRSLIVSYGNKVKQLLKEHQ